MKRVATLILNRNLPDVTNSLYEHLQQHDRDFTDIYVIEAGSDKENLSKYATWHAEWPQAKKEGLRYSRGMNFGLQMLWNENKFETYDAFFLITNDTELEKAPTIAPLLNLLDAHPRVGLLSPCGRSWGERFLLEKELIKYFWFIHNNAYLLRKDFIKSVFCEDQPGHMNFLFDGENFRGYGSESELIAKGYVNDWASAISTSVWVGENESYLLDKSDLIKTESYQENLALYLIEGEKWMRKKYGFNSKWSMNQYVKSTYENFFEFHPECRKYRI